MANPNPQLEAALAQFGAQPGTTPDQAAQLRAAVVAAADRLDVLNQQAAKGQLNSFALETPGGSPNLTGTYDKAAGVVTLPAGSFQRGGSVTSSDLDAVVGLQAITVEFAHKTWQEPAGLTQTVNQVMVDNLQSTLNGSPVLAAQIKDAVAQGYVQHFSLLDNSMAAGATYDGNTVQQDGTPKGINLPPRGLQTNSPTNPQGLYDVKDMTFVLSHEIQHGFNDAAKDQATLTFLQDITTQAQMQGPVHDYTDELRAYIQAGREDEATANIAGWNALLSRERQTQPNGNGLDLMLATTNDRVLDFVVRDPVNPLAAVPKPGLTFNLDGGLSQTPANIAAMGQHYFDRPSHVHAQPGQRPVGLGAHSPPSADYTNYYGTWALERIFAAEGQANVQHQGALPQIAIDMSSLGLKEDLIEMEGLDLGANKAPRPYLDTSQTPPVPGHFHHTEDASMGHDHQHVPILASGRIPPSGDPVIDRWIDALQDGDFVTARTVQREFTLSPEGERLWADGLTDAHAWEAQQKPWLAQAREIPLFNQASAQLARLDSQAGHPWTGTQREQLAGTLALEALRERLPGISNVTQNRYGELVAEWQHPNHRILDRSTHPIDPNQASEQPLQQSLQQFNDENRRQEQQTMIDAQQRQASEQSQGMVR